MTTSPLYREPIQNHATSPPLNSLLSVDVIFVCSLMSQRRNSLASESVMAEFSLFQKSTIRPTKTACGERHDAKVGVVVGAAAFCGADGCCCCFCCLCAAMDSMTSFLSEDGSSVNISYFQWNVQSLLDRF